MSEVPTGCSSEEGSASRWNGACPPLQVGRRVGRLGKGDWQLTDSLGSHAAGGKSGSANLLLADAGVTVVLPP